MAKIYALYKGDEYVTDGTLEELAEKTGKKLASLEWMLTPTAKKRAGAGSSALVYLGEEINVKRCVVCGKAFRAKSHPNKKYCSEECQKAGAKILWMKRTHEQKNSLICRKASVSASAYLAGKYLSRIAQTSVIARSGAVATVAATEVQCSSCHQRNAGTSRTSKRSMRRRGHRARATDSCKLRSCWRDCTRR